MESFEGERLYLPGWVASSAASGGRSRWPWQPVTGGSPRGHQPKFRGWLLAQPARPTCVCPRSHSTRQVCMQPASGCRQGPLPAPCRWAERPPLRGGYGQGRSRSIDLIQLHGTQRCGRPGPGRVARGLAPNRLAAWANLCPQPVRARDHDWPAAVVAARWTGTGLGFASPAPRRAGPHATPCGSERATPDRRAGEASCCRPARGAGHPRSNTIASLKQTPQSLRRMVGDPVPLDRSWVGA